MILNSSQLSKPEIFSRNRVQDIKIVPSESLRGDFSCMRVVKLISQVIRWVIYPSVIEILFLGA